MSANFELYYDTDDDNSNYERRDDMPSQTYLMFPGN